MTAARPRVVAFTPVPPSSAGGAVYAGVLLRALGDHVEVIVVCPQPADRDPSHWSGPTTAPMGFEPRPGDVLVHFLANDPDHLFAYRSALRWRGVTVCHELGLRHLLHGLAPDAELADLVEQVGEQRALRIRDRWERGVATEREAFLHTLISRPLRCAEAVVVHSRYAQLVVEAEVPDVPVHVVASHVGAVPSIGGDAVALRHRLGLPRDAFVVGMFGHLGGHKRVPQAIDGVARAVAALGTRRVDARLVVVGTGVGVDLEALIAARSLRARTTVTGPVDEQTFFEHMAAVDAVVTLRHPALGESSAVLMQAMQLGKPVVTSDYAQFAEERAAIHVAPDDKEVDGVADALVRLATCPQCRRQVAVAGRARARTASVDAAVAGYLEVIDSVVRRRRGSAQAAMSGT